MNEPRPAMISARPPEMRSTRRELLEDANGIVRAEDADRARQPDPARPRRRGGEHDRGRRDDEVGTVVLTDAEDVEPDLLGELDLLEQLRHAPLRACCPELGERVDAQFHDDAVSPKRVLPGGLA